MFSASVSTIRPLRSRAAANRSRPSLTEGCATVAPRFGRLFDQFGMRRRDLANQAALDAEQVGQLHFLELGPGRQPMIEHGLLDLAQTSSSLNTAAGSFSIVLCPGCLIFNSLRLCGGQV